MKTDSKTSDQSNIFQSSASYYNPASKKWEIGIFSLNKNHIQFVRSTSNNYDFHLCLPLKTITGIEKRLSNFIYPSLVVCIGAEKHWFGSFTSRDAVYNVLELFWRESLISKSHRKPSSKKPMPNSALGKDLLDILYESEKTLIGAANALSDQSRQLHESEQDVEDINTDLVRAEEAIKSLSSPLSLLSFQNKSSERANESEPRMQKYKVTFSFSNSDDKVDWEKGTLVITNDVISLKVDENAVMQVTKDELKTFEVLSPWELCITHTFSDVQKSCYFMCPQLSRLLKFVSSIPPYKDKIVYSDDDSSVYETASCSSRSSFGSTRNSPSSSDAQSISSRNFNSADSSQIQANVLSDEEIQELGNVLQNLQNLASEVSQEQESQMERINSLVENIEKVEIKMKADNKTIKKMS